MTGYTSNLRLDTPKPYAGQEKATQVAWQPRALQQPAIVACFPSRQAGTQVAAALDMRKLEAQMSEIKKQVRCTRGLSSHGECDISV